MSEGIDWTPPSSDTEFRSMLVDALVEAFQDDMEHFVWAVEQLGEGLFVPDADRPEDKVQFVVLFAVRKNCLERLLEQCFISRPRSQQLNSLYHFLGREASRLLPTNLRGLQQSGLDPRQVGYILEATKRVCRIFVGEKARGTGFLIGPNQVLTNWHVVKEQNPPDIHVKFDKTEASPAHELGLEDLANIPYSDFHPRDLLVGPFHPNEPTCDHLDYAVLTVNQAVTRDRGWYNIECPISRGFTNEDQVFLLQHPFGGPLLLSKGLVKGANIQNTRVRYNAASSPGSSGSPVLDHAGRPVALHHSGNGVIRVFEGYGQGIPISTISDDLAEDLESPDDDAEDFEFPYSLFTVGRSELRSLLPQLDTSGAPLFIDGEKNSGKTHSLATIRFYCNKRGYTHRYRNLTALVDSGLSAYNIGKVIAEMLNLRAFPVLNHEQPSKWQDQYFKWLNTSSRSLDTKYWLIFDGFLTLRLPLDTRDFFTGLVMQKLDRVSLVFLGMSPQRLPKTPDNRLYEAIQPITKEDLCVYLEMVYQERRERRGLEFTPPQLEEAFEKVWTAAGTGTPDFLRNLNLALQEEVWRIENE
jgi:Trypsin-like peptidase domain